ncbi:MAG: GntR family transcriptional regulator [Deltaproteobacteria bacterium]|nr:GntR family transcriptional regulator [Deltaproteobacteria bacterium]MBW2305645.1 GntR family transcriptional regulator [Deltaproteobacteria bacterium]
MKKRVAGPIPLYYQIGNILRDKIHKGEYKLGERFPSEKELCVEFGVSRITIRQTLASMADQGLLNRQRGRGTFVQEKPRSRKVYQFGGFLEDLAGQVMRLKAHLIRFEPIDPGSDIRQILRLGPQDEVFIVERVRLSSQEPILHAIHYIPGLIARQFDPADLYKQNIMEIIEKKCGISISHAEQTMVATLADATMSEILQVRIGAPLLKIRRTFFAIDHQPVENVLVHYRGDMYEFVVRLNRRDEDNKEK